MSQCNKKLFAAAILTAGALALPALAMAQNTPWYAGASIGQSKAKDACSGLGGTGVNCDDTDTAWRIFGGYRINRNFAAELGYTDLGEAKASALGAEATVKSKAFDLVGVGILPLADSFSAYGKLGLYRADSKGDSNVGLSASETNTDLTFGLGIRYDVSANLGLQAEWQRYSDVGGGDIGKSDVDVLGIGVLWRF